MKILQDRDDGIDEEELDEDIMVNNSNIIFIFYFRSSH